MGGIVVATNRIAIQSTPVRLLRFGWNRGQGGCISINIMEICYKTA